MEGVARHRRRGTRWVLPLTLEVPPPPRRLVSITVASVRAEPTCATLIGIAVGN